VTCDPRDYSAGPQDAVQARGLEILSGDYEDVQRVEVRHERNGLVVGKAKALHPGDCGGDVDTEHLCGLGRRSDLLECLHLGGRSLSGGFEVVVEALPDRPADAYGGDQGSDVAPPDQRSLANGVFDGPAHGLAADAQPTREVDLVIEPGTGGRSPSSIARKRDGELEVQRHRTRRIERVPVEDDLDDIVRLRLRPLTGRPRATMRVCSIKVRRDVVDARSVCATGGGQR
jgi:hypothetical protein